MIVVYGILLYMVFQIGNHFGNVNKGKKRSLEAKKRMSDAAIGRVYSKERNKKISLSRMGNKHPLWKEKGVSYSALHSWVKRHFPKPELCVKCKIAKARDLANISHEYKRDLSDWEWLCHKCHMEKDGITKRLVNERMKRDYKGNKSPLWKGGTPKCIDCGKPTGQTYKAIRCRKCYLKLKIRGKRDKYE